MLQSHKKNSRQSGYSQVDFRTLAKSRQIRERYIERGGREIEIERRKEKVRQKEGRERDIVRRRDI